jgi:hypothetical protein
VKFGRLPEAADRRIYAWQAEPSVVAPIAGVLAELAA